MVKCLIKDIASYILKMKYKMVKKNNKNSGTTNSGKGPSKPNGPKGPKNTDQNPINTESKKRKRQDKRNETAKIKYACRSEEEKLEDSRKRFYLKLQ